MAGYSGTPLGKKLGIKPQCRAWLQGMPSTVKKVLAKELATVTLVEDAQSGIDFIHVFVGSLAELKKQFAGWKKKLAKDGVLWVSWPKKTSSMASDLNENILRDVGLAAGLVDVKVCAVDEDWSGLKFVYRKTDR
jgi:hypothetical protein